MFVPAPSEGAAECLLRLVLAMMTTAMCSGAESRPVVRTVDSPVMTCRCMWTLPTANVVRTGSTWRGPTGRRPVTTVTGSGMVTNPICPTTAIPIVRGGPTPVVAPAPGTVGLRNPGALFEILFPSSLTSTYGTTGNFLVGGPVSFCGVFDSGYIRECKWLP